MDNDTTDIEKDRVWLSDLPDEILQHILSFLPTKPLVATSLLSGRWQFLWAHTRNLELDESLFDDHDQFINFAERAFALRDGSPLVSFSLSCGLTRDINTLIISAILHNVEQISLSLCHSEFDADPTFLFPCFIFGCQSLVKLSLRLCGITIRYPSVLCRLTRLKHLELKRIKFVDDESTEKLLSHPLLEELIISDCDWREITTVNVNSPKLQFLAIDDGFHNGRSPADERQICFFGDNLKFFRYKGSLPFQYCICGSTMQLRDAQILEGIPDFTFFGISMISKPYKDLDCAFKRYCKLVNSLLGVQNLTLMAHHHTGLSRHVFRPSLEMTFPVVFEHVTRLNLTSDYRKICINTEWSVMIFKRCPHLERLNFMQALDCLPVESSSPIPPCFGTHLKRITSHTYGTDDFDEQHAAIDILLRSAPVLEEMVLYLHLENDALISHHSSRVEELERELNTRPKVSENCRVSILVLL